MKHQGTIGNNTDAPSTQTDASAQWADALDILALGIIRADYDGNCLFANPAACRMLQLPNAPHGNHIDNFDAVPAAHAALASLMSKARDGRDGTETITHDDATLELRIKPLIRDSHTQMVITVEDVTWRAISDRERDAFLSLVSHELRTPLTVMKGYLDILKRGLMGTLDEEQSGCVDMIREQCKYLEYSIRDLMRFKALVRENPESARDRIEVEPLLRSVVHDYHARFPAEDNAAVINVDSDLVCIGHADYVQDVIHQLVDNVVKFAGGKQLKVGASSFDLSNLPAASERLTDNELDADATWVHIWVSDGGPGFKEESRHEMVQPFQQGEDHMTRHHRGLGLGLAIVQRVVELSGGTMWIDVSETNGAEVSVVLRRG